MPEPKKGIQLANNITELTAIAPLVPGGADKLRLLIAQRKEEEKRGKPGPLAIIETIHYARWVILDGGTKLLFTSNFDGDLDGYLREFAERDEVPLNAIFQFCEGWPGARPVGPFIDYVRKHMVPAEYYYAAYPQYTVKEVRRALYWKERTEEFINEHLSPLAELITIIKSCKPAHDAVSNCLGTHGRSINDLSAMEEKLREFLGKLAVPTPGDFGKNR
jgi:hypothetical protein